jgi:hypothetical protein
MNRNDLRYLKRPRDIGLFLRVFFSLGLLRILVPVVKMPRLLALVLPKDVRKRPLRSDEVERLLKFIDFFLHRIFRSRNPCLFRSLLLLRHMRSAGLDVRIAFGVGNLDGPLKGHAWLIHNGGHFLEREDPTKRYEAVFVYP